VKPEGGTYPPAGPQGRRPLLPPLGNEEAHPRLGPSDMGLSGPIKPQQTGKPRNSRHRPRGGKGRLLGNGAAVDLASQCRRDITTIFQPASLTPHSHRRPPFFSSLLQNSPFSLFPLGPYRIWSSFSPVACGNLSPSRNHRPLTAFTTHRLRSTCGPPRLLVDTQPYPSHQAGLTRSLEVTFCEQGLGPPHLEEDSQP
jgi:hypothetical protein